MACQRGVVYELSWVTIHNMKPTCVDFYHVEGFQDWVMYLSRRYGLKIYTRDETPCWFTLDPTRITNKAGKFVKNYVRKKGRVRPTSHTNI